MHVQHSLTNPINSIGNKVADQTISFIRQGHTIGIDQQQTEYHHTRRGLQDQNCRYHLRISTCFVFQFGLELDAS